MKKFKFDKYKVLGIICLLLSLPIIFRMISSVFVYLESPLTLGFVPFALEFLGDAITVIFFFYIFSRTIISGRKLNKIEWTITLIIAALFIISDILGFFVVSTV